MAENETYGSTSKLKTLHNLILVNMIASIMVVVGGILTMLIIPWGQPWSTTPPANFYIGVVFGYLADLGMLLQIIFSLIIGIKSLCSRFIENKLWVSLANIIPSGFILFWGILCGLICPFVDSAITPMLSVLSFSFFITAGWTCCISISLWIRTRKAVRK